MRSPEEGSINGLMAYYGAVAMIPAVSVLALCVSGAWRQLAIAGLPLAAIVILLCACGPRPSKLLGNDND